MSANVEDYHGYVMKKLDVDGCESIIVEPKNPLPGKKWVWKAEFFEAFPKFELSMLEKGFYLCFMNVNNTFGCPSAMEHFDEFYRYLTEEEGFSKYPVLLGLSRGGLYIYSWVTKNPDKVSCLYADNPVCDFKSWPGGKGEGPGSPENWEKLLGDYGFGSEQEALDYNGNPVDSLEPLAKAGVPLIHAATTEDEVVPIRENTDVLEKRYLALGGNIKVIRHPGKHHPHGLEDPAPIIEFILKNGIGIQ